MNALAVSVGENLAAPGWVQADLVAQVKVFVVGAGVPQGLGRKRSDGRRSRPRSRRATQGFQTKFVPRKAKWDNSSGERSLACP